MESEGHTGRELSLVKTYREHMPGEKKVGKQTETLKKARMEGEDERTCDKKKNILPSFYNRHKKIISPTKIHSPSLHLAPPLHIAYSKPKLKALQALNIPNSCSLRVNTSKETSYAAPATTAH